MLREIMLPDGITGRLFRAPMPGRYDWSLKQAMKDIRTERIDLIVCLPPLDEIRELSPRYARLIENEGLPVEIWELSVPERGVPDDEEEFFELARDVAYELRDGAYVLMHCYAGIGRTGTLAIITLLALGAGLEDARRAVELSGAGPESPPQEKLIERAARVIRLGD